MAQKDVSSFINLRNGKTDTAREEDIRKYSYFLGVMDTTHNNIQQFDVQRSGYGRFFVLQMPKFVKALLPDATKKVEHLLEFANIGVDGIQGYAVDFASLNSNYTGTTIEIPTATHDETTSVTIKIYETYASLIRSYIDFWVTGVSDPYTGVSHYHGALDIADNGIEYVSQTNHTMEGIYVATDPSGQDVQYACLLVNMFPKGSDHSSYTYEQGSHDLVQLNLEFTAIKYMTPQITKVAQKLITDYGIRNDSYNFKSHFMVGQTGKPYSADKAKGSLTKKIFGGAKYLTDEYKGDTKQIKAGT